MAAQARMRVTALGALALLAGAAMAPAAQAQNYPITSEQRATAQQVASRGVPFPNWPPMRPIPTW